MSNRPDQHDDDSTASPDSSSGGQVSEVSGMTGEPDAIDPSDATAGTPDGESGTPQEGEAGPDAAPHDNVRSNRT